MPKSSFAVTPVDTNLSSITKVLLYFVAVYAAPEPTLISTMVVSCKSKVVSPESNFISLELLMFADPMTTRVPVLSMSSSEPNCMFV